LDVAAVRRSLVAMSSPTAPDRSTTPESVVIHASWRGLLNASLSPVLLLLLGGGALWSAGTLRLVPILLVGLGVALGAIVAADFPRHSVFHRHGVTRRCLLRSELLPWSRIVAIERTAPSAAGRLRDLGGDRRAQPKHGSGGLVARGPGRTRWLLTDRVEGAAEHDRVCDLLRRLDVPTVMRADRPSEETSPSYLYRRKR
jgi:hypothetical protein